MMDIWGAVLLYNPDFLISEIRYFFLYQKILFDITNHFLISKNRFFDIRKSNFGYQKIEFLISKINYDFFISENRIFDIRNSIF